MDHESEVATGRRFAFGENWASFLAKLDESRIDEAERSLSEMLETNSLEGKTFLDVGSGSGLFSLAARRLGAKVHSFDYDPSSVACTLELRRRYFPGDAGWTVEQGSVLDSAYLGRLGQFDVVYSWGVLHHTGEMWSALENVAPLVAAKGQLFIAIYNDQGMRSRIWKRLKRAYVASPKALRPPLLLITWLGTWSKTLIRDTLSGNPLRSWRSYAHTSRRGMSAWHDLIDWAGGFPFEVAKPEQIIHFYRAHGFELTRLITCGGGLGCNEFVFIEK